MSGLLDQTRLIEEEMLEDDEVLVEVGTHFATTSDIDAAHAAAKRMLELGRAVTPFRVVLASLIMFLIFSTIAAGWYWGMPRDAMNVELVYMQSGPGQVVLAEVQNRGSREVTDLSVEITFSDLQGEVLGSNAYHRSYLPAHTSAAGDDLEVVVSGVSGWDEYIITVTLVWVDGNGARHIESWSHQVGEWMSESFTEKANRHYWLF